ncbi:ligase-associated DNA damage response DEXH box helicase [Acidomonas methanolica]|uniref:ligase-associated DNA damage response DEXH box helicase n=1 Tax=Acidomonas methanolica TaxID=437 RepID=UPI001C03E1BD|nr:ligase-associated DNA damage response DEXH box helicase [Acidomonas methanolica]MBU2654497.1 ligase-associated DNA damage response DEXH box helicase [Acidomonas methanolica]
MTLPALFSTWFTANGWHPYPHQIEMAALARKGQSALLIAPTGGGKTLAGFLPSLIELSETPPEQRRGIHTVYISPLKALTADIARTLSRPVAEMDLPVRIESRTGDTSAAARARQRAAPPDILLTTPESLALMLSWPDSPALFGNMRAVVIDEIHALYGTKRGDHLALCLARLSRLAPQARRTGLSATIADPATVAAFLAPGGEARRVRLVQARAGAPPDVRTLIPSGMADSEDWYLPWAGHMGVNAAQAVLSRIRAAGMSIVFVNTRAQAELIFQALWRINDETLPIALHHGSLEIEQRSRVETAMAEGKLRAIVATASLDLGIDWAGVDQILQIGAPKSVSRLMQRIGRANHRLDEPSRALLVPASRFEVLECEAARQAVAAGDLDGPAPRPGGLDVLAQHVLGMACAAPFTADALYAEITSAGPYAALARADFDDVLAYVEHGGYALRAYDRHRRLVIDSLGQYWVRNEQVVRQYRMNIGTIVEAPMLRIRLRGGPVLGEVEEYFANQLTEGDSFVFGGEQLVFLGIRDMAIEVARGSGDRPKIPVYGGSWMAITSNLARRVRALLHDKRAWPTLPDPVREWLAAQARRSELPGEGGLLVETFPRHGHWHLVAYTFEGRNAHQTLGLLLTRRLERAGCGPLGFVATDYVIACWCLREPTDIAELFSEDMLGEDLDDWMAESSLLRRSFRNVAIIAGLVDRDLPSRRKTGRQITVSTDLLYDVLRKHQPDHILLRATWADAASGLTDLSRIAAMLRRAREGLVHRRLDHISPLAVPIMLEMGRERVGGMAEDELLAEAEMLMAEAIAPATNEPLPDTGHSGYRSGERRRPPADRTTDGRDDRANRS